MRVTVIDYKAGNLTSVLKALRHLGAEVEVTDADLAPIASAERIVLPGVGHFAATQYLDSTGLNAPPSVMQSDGESPSLAFVSACSGFTRDRPKHLVRPVSAIFQSSVRAFRKAMKRCRTWVGTRLKRNQTRVCSKVSNRGSLSTSRTPTRLPSVQTLRR